MNDTTSPCVRICCLNDDDICLGCFRRLEEIVGWTRSTDQQKLRILKQTEIRRAHYRNKALPGSAKR